MKTHERTWVDAEGQEHTAPESPRTMKCSVCGGTVKPIFKSTPDPESWFFQECETCEEPCCDKCSHVNDDASRECINCYETRKVLERAAR